MLTAENLVRYTRGLTLRKFKEELPHWYADPEWIRQEESGWNNNDLDCLSKEQKMCSSFYEFVYIEGV